MTHTGGRHRRRAGDRGRAGGVRPDRGAVGVAAAPMRARWSGSATTRRSWPPPTAGWWPARTSCSRAATSAGTGPAPADVGRKAAARSLIDVAAMGAVPTGLLVALAAPPDLPVSWARDLTEGLAAECARAGRQRGRRGHRPRRVRPARHHRPGRPGGPGSGAPLRRGARRPGRGDRPARPRRGRPGPAGSRAPATCPWTPLVAAHRGPLRPTTPVRRRPDLGATAMIDISDGLLADLGHIAAASGVLIDLSSDRLSPGDGTCRPRPAPNFIGGTGRGASPEQRSR